MEVAILQIILLQNFQGVVLQFFWSSKFSQYVLYIFVCNDLLKVNNKDTGTTSLPYNVTHSAVTILQQFIYMVDTTS